MGQLVRHQLRLVDNNVRNLDINVKSRTVDNNVRNLDINVKSRTWSVKASVKTQ